MIYVLVYTAVITDNSSAKPKTHAASEHLDEHELPPTWTCEDED